MDPPTDQELARRAQSGELQAYGELVQRYQAAVFSVCYRLLGERREAEDLAQEAFIRAHQRLHLYDLQRPFGPWIRRVAANLCLNHLDVQRAASYALEDEWDHPALVQPGTPETLHAVAERAEAVRQALLSLPAHYRAVIELRHFHECSYTEISEQLSIPLSDVKSHLFRARQILAQKLKPYED
jgi:RNA polymerase sigma-70 factor (ECF subfamily)